MENKDYKLIKEACERVYTQLDYGLAECAYQTALVEELRDIGYDNLQCEYHVHQYYTTSTGRKVQIADLRIDILIEERIILELKSIDGCLKKMTKDGELKIEEIKKLKEYKQCQRYKNIKNITEGYLINFGKKQLDFIKV